jgi:hypothetical protein
MRFLLLTGMDWTDDHQGLMLLGVGLTLVLGLIFAYPN